jgi:hypothetical protein
MTTPATMTTPPPTTATATPIILHQFDVAVLLDKIIGFDRALIFDKIIGLDWAVLVSG